jgi:hypothetical protein
VRLGSTLHRSPILVSALPSISNFLLSTSLYRSHSPLHSLFDPDPCTSIMDPNEQPSWTGGDAPDKEKMEQASRFQMNS